MDRAIEQFLENLEAGIEMIHTYTCFYCQIASAQETVVIVEDVEGGVNVKVLGVCNTCSGKGDA